MGPIDALWHLLNFIAPALAVGALSAALVKLAWRRELAGARWSRLAAGYALLVAASALALWWSAFVSTKR
jgi:hypothetical protein